MNLDREEIKAAIRAKVIDLAKALKIDATGLSDSDIIPATGYLDSTAILELVVWYEQTYNFPLKQDEINIDNLGSINTMTDFLLARKGGSALSQAPLHR
jgi:acyl carrier protein